MSSAAQAAEAPVTTAHVAAAGVRTALVPAAAEAPAAGECEDALDGPVAVVELASDMPYPRCQVVRADQRLRVVNATGLEGEAAQVVTVTLAGLAPRSLRPGQEVVIPAAFGDVLAPGVHRVGVSLYPGSGPELWLRR